VLLVGGIARVSWGIRCDGRDRRQRASLDGALSRSDSRHGGRGSCAPALAKKRSILWEDRGLSPKDSLVWLGSECCKGSKQWRVPWESAGRSSVDWDLAGICGIEQVE
jgi:hypothetical protein